MGDIAGFITRMLDRDEAAAGEERTWMVRHHECHEFFWDPCEQVPCPEAAECAEGRCDHKVINGSDGMIIYDEGGHDALDAEHIVRHDPARALRGVAFGRVLLEQHERQEPGPYTPRPYCGCQCPDGVVFGEWPCEEVSAFAAIWSDDPGYEEAVSG